MYRLCTFFLVYSDGISTDPLLISSMISCGGRPSTVQPMFWAVPRISLAVPLNSRAIERGLKVRAMAMISSMVMLPLCLTVNRTRWNWWVKCCSRQCKSKINSHSRMTLTVLDLLSVTWWFFQCFDDQRSSRWNDRDGGLSVLNGQADGDFQTLPVTGSLGDVITDFLWRLWIEKTKQKLVYGTNCDCARVTHAGSFSR